jgi:hypothetical protein
MPPLCVNIKLDKSGSDSGSLFHLLRLRLDLLVNAYLATNRKTA